MSHPWMPLYVGDYLSKTQRLNAAEHGAYVLLIMEYWQAGEPPPDDDDKLARICRMTPREWRKARPTLAGFFYDGWHHHRVEEELGKADAKHGRRVEAGQRGGIAASRAKQTDSNATSNATPFAQASSSQPQLQPETIAPSLRSGGAPARKRRSPGSPLPADWQPSSASRQRGRDLGFTENRIDDIAEDLRVWANGKGELRADWDATFDGFVRRDAKERASNGNGKIGAHDRLYAAAADVLNDMNNPPEIENGQLRLIGK